MTSAPPNAPTLQELEDDVRKLVENFLARTTANTRRAYASDLDVFARWLGQTRDAAIGELLAAGVEDAPQLVLNFAAQLGRGGRAPATIDRRVGTLSALVRLAEARGLVGWCINVRDWASRIDEVAAVGGDDVAYVLPRHPAEATRLDLQHYALVEALGGQQHLAPVQTPGRVLDVGAGTGQWGYDVCVRHPQADVVGLDLVRPKPGAPQRYRAVRGNVLHGLPFASSSFGFVHQRLMFTGVPVVAWPAIVAELVRVCGPGGWVELVEGATRFERDGPATQRLVELLLELNRTTGLDTDSTVFRSLDQYLTDAGMDEVERRAVELPMGEWGGKLGSLMASDVRALFTRLAPAFGRLLGVAAQECVELVRAAQPEWEALHTTYSVAFAWGRKAEGRVGA